MIVSLVLRCVLLVSGEAPWSVRLAEITAKAAINLEAEHKVTQLNEELQSLLRQIRMRVGLLTVPRATVANIYSQDQQIQESNVKIELMERRSETVKKHVRYSLPLAYTLSDT